MNKLNTFDPLDILVRDLFNSHSNFKSIIDTKSPHPVDIYEHSNGLVFEIACTGLDKEDICIDTELDILKISYNKPRKDEKDESDESDRVYQCKNIARRSFNLAYKISPKYCLTDSKATMENGLLIINIPFAEEAKPKRLQIK